MPTGYLTIPPYLSGVSTFLAHLLILIVLYYLFKYLLEKHTDWEKAGRIKAVAAILSLVFTALVFFLFMSVASEAVAVVATLVFVILVVFLIVVAAAKIVGLDILSLFRRSGL